MQQILNMLLVQQLPPSLPDSMEPGVKQIVANALQHEVGVRPAESELQEYFFYRRIYYNMNMSFIFSLISSYQKGCEFRGAVSSSRHRQHVQATARPVIGQVLLQVQKVAAEPAKSRFQWVP